MGNGEFVIGDGVLPVALLAIEVAALQISIAVCLEINRSGVVGNRPVDLSLTCEHKRSRFVGARSIGVEIDSGAEIGIGRIVLILKLVCECTLN
jgi:hypothetical protein